MTRRFYCFDPDESAYDMLHPRDFVDGWDDDEENEDIDPRLVCDCGNDKLSSDDFCTECGAEE